MIRKNSIKLYFTFYKSYCFVSILITFVCAYFFLKHGPSVYAVLFWFKIITLALIFFYIREYKSKEFYFYKNLGISKKTLWAFSLSFDMVLYFTAIIIALNIYGKLT